MSETMSDERIEAMVLDIIEQHDEDAVQWYRSDTSEDPLLGQLQLAQLVETAKEHLARR